MSPPTTIFEPSFADLISAIEKATEPSAPRRRHWVCSVRQRWCPAEWCNSGVAVVIAGGHGRCCQVATAGNLTIGSSLKGAIVSRLM